MSQDGDSDKLVINVGGVKFETFVTTLQNIADTRLSWLTENRDDNEPQKEFFFDRHPGVFVHILNFYRTGKLHTPTDVCGPLFGEELQFWGIDEKQMEPCCWETFTKHREAEENLRWFQGPYFEDLRCYDRKMSTVSNYKTSYLKNKFSFIWKTIDDPYSSKLAKRFSIVSCAMICISIAAYCLATMPNVKQHRTLSTIFKVINYICLTFFTLELIIRIIVSPDKKTFIKNYPNWLDFLSVVPSYLLLVFPDNAFIQNLVIIRLFRVIKFFKLSYGLQVFMQTLKSSSYELTLLLLLLLIPVVIFSSLVYAVEFHIDGPNSKFDSIPTTFWWCLITMTTVGYGDLTPVTWPGRFVGSLSAIIGVLIVALPISVIGSNFSVYYAHVKARLKLPKKNRYLLQGNLRGLLRQTLSSRDKDRRNIKRNAGMDRVNNNAIRRKGDQLSPDGINLNQRRKYAYQLIAEETNSNSSNETARESNTADDVSGNTSIEMTSPPVHRRSECRRRGAILQQLDAFDLDSIIDEEETADKEPVADTNNVNLVENYLLHSSLSGEDLRMKRLQVERDYSRSMLYMDTNNENELSPIGFDTPQDKPRIRLQKCTSDMSGYCPNSVRRSPIIRRNSMKKLVNFNQPYSCPAKNYNGRHSYASSGSCLKLSTDGMHQKNDLSNSTVNIPLADCTASRQTQRRTQSLVNHL